MEAQIIAYLHDAAASLSLRYQLLHAIETVGQRLLNKDVRAGLHRLRSLVHVAHGRSTDENDIWSLCCDCGVEVRKCFYLEFSNYRLQAIGFGITRRKALNSQLAQIGQVAPAYRTGTCNQDRILGATN